MMISDMDRVGNIVEKGESPSHTRVVNKTLDCVIGYFDLYDEIYPEPIPTQ